MADAAGVGEVEDADFVVLGEGDAERDEVGEDGHAVGDVDDAGVVEDLGDEVAVREVVGDGHSETED